MFFQQRPNKTSHKSSPPAVDAEAQAGRFARGLGHAAELHGLSQEQSQGAGPRQGSRLVLSNPLSLTKGL